MVLRGVLWVLGADTWNVPPQTFNPQGPHKLRWGRKKLQMMADVEGPAMTEPPRKAGNPTNRSDCKNVRRLSVYNIPTMCSQPDRTLPAIIHP